MKILFLDIDGVLNSAQTFEDKHRHDAIDTTMVERINKVVEQTECKIVISSTWRILWTLGELSHILRLHGLRDVVIGETPDLGRRDVEILAWLEEHPEVQQFAVVDDDAHDLTKVSHRLVQTSFYTGILDEHTDKLIELLSKPV